MDLYSLATFLMNGTIFFLLFTLGAAVATHYQIIEEERFLRRQYGPAYDDYCRGTSRYLGRKDAGSPSPLDHLGGRP